jgi:hypothetical protein
MAHPLTPRTWDGRDDAAQPSRRLTEGMYRYLRESARN